MRKVTIMPGCITCGLCAAIAPDIFEVTDVARVKQESPSVEHSLSIQQAVSACPVQVIEYTLHKNEKTA